jgi:hypothetical protein
VKGARAIGVADEEGFLWDLDSRSMEMVRFSNVRELKRQTVCDESPAVKSEFELSSASSIEWSYLRVKGELARSGRVPDRWMK